MARPLLFLSPRVPHPLNTGAKIRTRALLGALQTAFEVDYAGFLQPELNQVEARAALAGCRWIKLVPEPAVTRAGKAWLGLRTLADRRPATVAKYDHPELARTIRRWAAEHSEGVIHADHIHMAGYLPRVKVAMKVIDEHNVEAVILERLAEQYGNSPAAPYFKLQARRMRATEARLVHQANLTLAVSEGDAEQLRALAPRRRIEVIPNGVDLEFYQGSGQPRTPGRLVFTGSMNWFPNEDGVLWFAREVWPQLAAEFTWDVVGHLPSPTVQAIHGGGVRVTGSVPDTRPYVNEAELFIVPLRIGGGSRLKILEAFAMGIPVLSTTVGCEGLGAEHGKNIWIADTPKAFADAIRQLHANPALAAELATNALSHVRAHFGWEAIGKKMINLIGA